MTSPTRNAREAYGQQVFEATRGPDGNFDEAKFFEKVEDDHIKRGNTDTALKRIARQHIAQIQATQDLVEVQKFFNCVEKIEKPEEKGYILAEAFGVFSKVRDLQGLALEVVHQQQEDKDRWLFNLIDACKKTKNKEIALKAASEISHPEIKKTYLAKINYGNLIKG